MMRLMIYLILKDVSRQHIKLSSAIFNYDNSKSPNTGIKGVKVN